MSEAKPFASLSSGLLARKGAAKPAMRPQGYGSFGSSLEDLGWDDMGHPGPLPGEHVPSSISALTPAPGGRQQEPFLHEVPAAQEEHLVEEPAFEEPVSEEPAFEEAAFEEPVSEDPVAEEVVAEEAVAEEPVAEAPVFEAPAEPPMVVEQQRALEARFEAPAPVVSLPRRKPAAAAPVPAAMAARAKAAFTLRLDPDRHLRLRLACAVTRQSAQQIVTGALDEYLASLPELEALAGHVPAGAGKRAG
jgi:hypothetical protein